MIEDYAAECRAAGHATRTIKLRLWWLAHVEAACPGGMLLTATRADLVRFLAHTDWSAETRKSARNAIRSFYTWATDEGLIAANPAARLPVVRVPAGTPRPASSAALRLALAGSTARDRLIVSLAAYAGLRRAEIAALPWTAVEDEALHVVGKGGRVRRVPLLPELAWQLAEVRQLRATGRMEPGWRYAVEPSSPWVLPAVGGGHMHPDTVGDLLSARLPDNWSGHTLRHRFATKAYAAERDLLTVQQLLGHSKPETTARYTAPPADAAARAVANVAA